MKFMTNLYIYCKKIKCLTFLDHLHVGRVKEHHKRERCIQAS